MSDRLRTSRSAQRRAARRRIMPGFPVCTPFQSIDEVRQYLSGDCIVCLLCGKAYRSIGQHITAIHDMTVDEYRQRYDIPWTYGLVCGESEQLYSQAAKKRMDEGWSPPMKTGDDLERLVSGPRRQTKFRAEISTQNLGDAALPKHPLSVGPNGDLETFTKRRERLTSKRGTKEYKEKMSNRSGLEERGRSLGKSWKGKKQTPEHLRNRMKAIHGKDWEPTPEDER